MSESNKETEQNAEEEKKSIDFEPLINALKDVLKDGNVNELAQNFNNVRLEKINKEKAINESNLASNLKFWKWKFSKDIIVIILLLASIVILSLTGVLSDSIVGTLLGSVIGYSIGNGSFKNKKS